MGGTTSTDGVAAHRYLLGFDPISRHGACWYYVWQAYAAAGASTGMGSSPTALAAWNLTSGKHPGDRNPPHGAAIWLGRRYDGNTDGDVFIAGPVDGQHAATDYPTWGRVGQVSIDARISQTGREYLGWSDHVLDCPIRLGGSAPGPNPIPTPETEGEPMFIAISPKNGFFLVLDQGSAKPRGVVLGGDSGAAESGIPILRMSWTNSWKQLRGAVDGLPESG